MTAIAATLIVALLVVVAVARLASIVAAGIEYVATRPARHLVRGR
jgi:hypothetical protein